MKDNQKDLKDDIKTYFDLGLKEESSDIAIVETNYEKEHGRIEKRKYYLSYDISCIHDLKKWSTIKAIGRIEKRKYYLSYDISCIHDLKKWSTIKAIGRIDVYREENNIEKITTHYYILSNNFTIDTFISSTRYHWNIECSLHWRLDVIMDEDHSRNRLDNSIENLATIRKIVFNLARLDTSMGDKLTLKQKMTRYTSNFKNIENLIFNVIPFNIL